MKHLLYLPFVLIALAVLAIVWFYVNALPASSDKNFQNFNVTQGSGAALIGDSLHKSNLIRSALAFKLFAQFSGVSNKIQAGEFRLSPSYSLFQVISELVRGPVEVWVTIPEGLRREEIAAKFATSLDKDTSFVTEFLQDSDGLEGYLFPDTYLFTRYASSSAIVAKMTQNFNTKTATLSPQGSGLSKKDLITLASLIERETKTEAERPIVAGILIKRINAGWPLQIDATVQYAVANVKCQMSNVKCSEWWQPLTSADLTIDSPYNTYKFPGLPPGPIANPGLSSITAAFNPAQSDYWYYIHGKNGQIHYAKTIEEQNANIAKYLQ